MKSIRKKSPSSLDWNKKASREMRKILKLGHETPSLRKRGPRQAWQATVSLVGAAAMTRLNRRYRGKNRPTDVLSFHPPEIFREQGQLGELVICLPVLKRQAKELGHRPEIELRILLIHGLLHLLGWDHEKGARQAALMAREEEKLLQKMKVGSVRGLIRRAG